MTPPLEPIGALDHIGIAVSDLPAAIAMYRDLMGLDVVGPVELAGQGLSMAFVTLQNTRVELICPTAPSCLEHVLGEHTVNAFLERHPGGGMHHVCYRVEALAPVLARLSTQGIGPLGDSIVGAHGTAVVFLDPARTGGALIELREDGHPS